MDLTPGAAIHGFSVVSCEDLPEIAGQAVVMGHATSGARLLYLKNDDNNKAFAIGFRTPPDNDTGVFHILEHSVLCGSDKFPVKEPFVDLLKGSMQTFLNAMTFPDKTLYPVASTNEQDLFNLMDVYLDAVFHPQIYHKRAIFEQEGWHYELTAPGAENANPAELPAEETQLVYNGVVYNEMKGALSDANSVLFDEVQFALFPDTPYAFESGGTPEAIPTLTYENYLDDHRRHYRTDNSYIVLYGNLDIDRALAFLDEEYLVPVAGEQKAEDERRAAEGLEPLRPRDLVLQAPVAAPYKQRLMETAPENACAATGYVIGTFADRERVMAVDVLLDALFGSNEAPLKRALLDQGIADNVSAFVADSLYQPFAMVQVNKPAEGQGAKLAETVASVVSAYLEAGLDHQLVEAALSHAEFQQREHELGVADGVADAMIALSSWLYDDAMPIAYLRYEDMFANLRAALDTDYYENLLAELFLENGHTAAVEVVPCDEAVDYDPAEELAQANAALSLEERQRIVDEEAVLRELQEAPDTPEAIATLPRLTVEDLGEAPEQPAYGLDWRTPITCLRHSVETHGIVYAYRYFDANHLDFEDLPYLSILGNVLGKLPTAQHTAAEIDTLVQGKLGNLTFFNETFEDVNDIDSIDLRFVVSASALSENAEWLATLPREIMLQTDFADTSKMRDVLRQRRIVMERTFASSGHSCAAARARSYYAPAGVVGEQLGNVGFYRFLVDLLDNFDERAEDLSARLSDVAARLFNDDNCTVSFAGSDQDYDRFWLAKPGCERKRGEAGRMVVPAPVCRNEAFIVPTDVCYAALGWDRRLLGAGYTGSWAVVARALSYDFLWNEVRVKGGAYGVGFQAVRTGNMRFYSYRDPHLDETLARFAKTGEWLASFDPSDEDMAGFLVATVAGIDAPVKPRALVRRQAGEFFCHQTPADRERMRAEVIATTRDDVRALAPVVDQLVEHQARCVFGNRDILKASDAGFTLVELLS